MELEIEISLVLPYPYVWRKKIIKKRRFRSIIFQRRTHNCSLTVRSSRYIVFDRKSIPIVACKARRGEGEKNGIRSKELNFKVLWHHHGTYLPDTCYRNYRTWTWWLRMFFQLYSIIKMRVINNWIAMKKKKTKLYNKMSKQWIEKDRTLNFEVVVRNFVKDLNYSAHLNRDSTRMKWNAFAT